MNLTLLIKPKKTQREPGAVLKQPKPLTGFEVNDIPQTGNTAIMSSLNVVYAIISCFCLLFKFSYNKHFYFKFVNQGLAWSQQSVKYVKKY